MSNKPTFKSPKPAGRPAGSPNKANDQAPRILNETFRCSQGFKETIKLLKEHANYKSDADVMAEALQLLALKKLPPEYLIWVNSI